MTYRYFVFGLHIQSEMEIPELLKDESNLPPDVKILIGETPEELTDCKNKGVTFQIANNELLLGLKGIARYYVKDGKEIIISPKPDSDERDIRLFLLGSCFGALLHQQKVLALHASAIVHEGKAVLFTGVSGAGKSTTANAFRLEGFKMLTDDICPIKMIDGVPYALPGYPQSKLWEDALEKLSVDYENLKKVRTKLNKRAVPITKDFETKAIPIKAIYRLQKHKKNDIELIDLDNANKFLLIKNMTYRHYFVKDMETHPYHFMNSSMLANKVPIKTIIRPETFCLPEVMATIKADLEQLNSLAV